jgi:hypothetical protein
MVADNREALRQAHREARQNYYRQVEALFGNNVKYAARRKQWKLVEEKFYEYGLFLERHLDSLN